MYTFLPFDQSSVENSTWTSFLLLQHINWMIMTEKLHDYVKVQSAGSFVDCWYQLYFCTLLLCMWIDNKSVDYFLVSALASRFECQGERSHHQFLFFFTSSKLNHLLYWFSHAVFSRFRVRANAERSWLTCFFGIHTGQPVFRHWYNPSRLRRNERSQLLRKQTENRKERRVMVGASKAVVRN